MTLNRVAQLLWRGALAAALFTVAVTAAAFDGRALNYAARYGNIDAGTVTVSIRADGDGYRVESVARPSPVAKLFGVKAQTDVTQFSRAGDGEIMLERGHTKRAGDGGEDWFRIDRDASRIEFSDAEARPIAAGEVFEAASFPLLLMLRARETRVDSIAEAQVTEVSARRAREYRYDAPVIARIKTSTGESDAWKITRHRVDRPDDTVTVWLRQRDAVPLKITVTKRGRRSSLLLTAGES